VCEGEARVKLALCNDELEIELRVKSRFTLTIYTESEQEVDSGTVVSRAGRVSSLDVGVGDVEREGASNVNVFTRAGDSIELDSYGEGAVAMLGRRWRRDAVLE
jgi:hypothetical protein